MSNLFPFRGHRFNPQKVGELDRVVTQPYDKISPAMGREYKQRSPHNVAHIICNPDYAQAGELLQEWIDAGALVGEASPCLYAYQQTFFIEGETLQRTGFICLVSLEHAAQTVKGHERVLDGPLQDRLRLMHATEANDGLIFSLFSDPSRQSDALLKSATGTEPDLEVEDDFGVTHRVWVIRDTGVQSQLLQITDALTLYIADGHHRFETACEYARQCWAKGWKPDAVESFDKRMMALFNMEGPGLRILPTHRAVKGLDDFDRGGFLSSLEVAFEVVRQQSLQEMRSALATSTKQLGLILGRPEEFYLLQPRTEPVEALRDLAPVAAELDVNLLHLGVLEPLLGIGPKELAAQSHVEYHRDAEEMARRVSEGDYQMGFLLRATQLSQVRSSSEAGIKMPQKSTDFFPKLLTGLVFSKMQIDKNGAE